VLIDGEGIVVASLVSPSLSSCATGSTTAPMSSAFDLIELAGRDLRKAPVEQRKGLLAMVMRPVCQSVPGLLVAFSCKKTYALPL
jgi:ATP-dependent DNA ligase